MSMRGVRKPGTLTVTSAVRGHVQGQPRHPGRGHGASSARPDRRRAEHRTARNPIGGPRPLVRCAGVRRGPSARGACATGGHGGRQRHARLLFRRWSLPRRPRPPSRTAIELAGAGADGARRRRRVDPARRRAGRRGRRGAPPGRPRRRGARAAAAVPVSIDTTQGGGRGRRARGRRHDRQRRVRPAPPTPRCSASPPTPAPGYVAMHMQGEPRTMQADPRYDDVVREVGDFLAERSTRARAAGVADDALVRRPRHRVRQDASSTTSRCSPLPELAAAVGVPVLVGTSRKTFLGASLGEARIRCRPSTSATKRRWRPSVWAVERGASMVRVHDVAARRRRSRCSTLDGAPPGGLGGWRARA